jgi:ribosome-binding protein aMBF1 (putative translation factor)
MGNDDTSPSPVGDAHQAASQARRARSPEYAAEAERVAPYEALARIVTRRRGALGLTQQQLAQRMETSHSAVSRIEAGRHRASVATLERLALALETRLVVGFVDDTELLGSSPLPANLVALT